jgi:crotonobetainyl-CoA:carnitine CoA-transferase CaiB-like acyl-CoA transferase
MAPLVQSRGNGPLTGLRVLDCTHVTAGSWCSMILADLGADVVKIEPPKGEVTRGRMGAFRAYDFLNRNKRAIAVDMSKPEGVDLLKRLAKDADIWVENFRPGTLDRAGLGYEALAAVNPSLIYASISGFGQDGPYRERGGLDLVAQAMSGIMSFVGNPGREPASTAVPIADLKRVRLRPSASLPPGRTVSEQARGSESRHRYSSPRWLTLPGSRASI